MIKTIIPIGIVLVILAVAIAPLHVSALPSAFSFNLISPNVAEATKTVTIGTVTIMPGDKVQLTGSGSFDQSTNSATGSGSITGINKSGIVEARGTWTITSFMMFTSYGGPSSGHQGGLLLVKVSITATSPAFGTMTITGLTLQVSCAINAPAGAPDEGTTLKGLFDQHDSGFTLFHETS